MNSQTRPTKVGTSQAAPAGGRQSILARRSIRFRLIAAVVLLLALFSLACVVSLATFELVDRARVFAENVDRCLLRTSELAEGISRQEGALRGYVLAGAARYRATLDEQQKVVEDTLHALQDAGASNQQRANLLDRIDQLESDWGVNVAEPVMAQVDTGQIEQARGVLIRGRSVAYFDPIRVALKSYRADLQKELDERNATLAHRQTEALLILLTMLAIGLIIGLVTIRAIIRAVTRPLSHIAEATQRLADGERDIRVAYQNNPDEIGAVARALEYFRQIIMAQDRETWLRDQRARLTVLLHHSDDEQTLGDALLAELAPLLGAGYAALFAPISADEADGRMALIAGFGYAPEASRVISPGDGLVGAVMQSGRTVTLDNVPADYLSIQSGLGSARPAHLLIAPALVSERVVAVLEVALLVPLDAQQQELVDTLLPNVALALLTHLRARRTRDLLERSREQTAALKASEARLREQQHSLEQINVELRAQGEELNAQSAELRASEEELKVQADELQAANKSLRGQQEELRLLNDQVGERAEALARASQYKSDFLANMSHELRTPLNSLLILSRSLADNDEGNLDEEQIEAARIIHDSGSNLLSLINDILDLSKIEAGKMHCTPEQISTAALVSKIQRQFAHVAKSRSLEFVVRAGPGAPETWVSDSGKIEQVIRNLVSNAFKFTERGRVQLDIGLPDSSTVFRTATLDGQNTLAIKVTDDGIGIPADRLEQIFQAFEQVDASTSRQYGGTGLGLSISRELARLLGGEITVESSPGKGSAFTVFVRRDLDVLLGENVATVQAPGSIVATPSAPPPPAVGTAGPRPARDQACLMVVDDDQIFANVVCKAARKRGFECVTVADGESALAQVAAIAPDAIVLDLGLPGIDGWAVLDRLKADPATRDIPVHIVSAADDTGQSSHAGAVGYLRKPIAREDLDKLLARAETLSGRKAQRVLVVDDDQDAQVAMGSLLSHEATEAISATTGRAAMELLATDRFDCVVLDLSLPDVSGFELLERIAAMPGAPPVVVYSARELSVEETMTLRAHTDSIVIKGRHGQDRLLDEISLFMHRIEDQTATHTPPAPAVPRSDADLAGCTVLMVDDDMRNTFALSRVLRARGLKVLMAADGFKALSQLEGNHDITIVLMDIMMPGMDGYETIRRIREQPRFQDLPIIALTAKAMAGDREKCIEAGATDYLPKPLDTDLLLERMKALL